MGMSLALHVFGHKPNHTDKDLHLMALDEVKGSSKLLQLIDGCTTFHGNPPNNC